MATGFKAIGGADLDTLFKAIGGSTPTSNTGFKNSAGTDLAQLFYASTSGGDRIASDTGFISVATGLDLKTVFRDITYLDSPIITSQPTAQSVNETATATFTIAATGLPTLTYQWRKGGVNLSNTGHYSGVTTTTLTISNADAGDAANYDCVVSNGIPPDATSNSVALTVVIIPVISGTTGAGNYNEGDVLTLTVSTSAGTTPFTYQWKLNGTNVSVGTGGTTSSYQFTLSSTLDGNYTCVVSNAAGSDTSSNVAIGIIAPVINGGTVTGGTGGSPPSGGGTYSFSDGGSVADFNVTTSAGANLSYVWKKDGSVLGAYTTAQGPIYNPAYIADSGVYSVEITNGGGTVSASVTMDVT